MRAGCGGALPPPGPLKEKYAQALPLKSGLPRTVEESTEVPARSKQEGPSRPIGPEHGMAKLRPIKESATQSLQPADHKVPQEAKNQKLGAGILLPFPPKEYENKLPAVRLTSPYCCQEEGHQVPTELME